MTFITFTSQNHMLACKGFTAPHIERKESLQISEWKNISMNFTTLGPEKIDLPTDERKLDKNFASAAAKNCFTGSFRSSFHEGFPSPLSPPRLVCVCISCVCSDPQINLTKTNSVSQLRKLTQPDSTWNNWKLFCALTF